MNKRSINTLGKNIFTLMFIVLFIVLAAASSFNLTFNSSDDIIFYNRTEINSTHGARLDAPKLFMSFGKLNLNMKNL